MKKDKRIIEKIDKDKLKNKGGKFINEFKDFIAKGNVLDLAVGVVIGSAFGKIVTSIVDDIIMPLVGVIIGGVDFSGLSTKIGDATITYGNFIQNVIDFLIIALCIFVFIKIISRFKRKEEAVEEAKRDEQVELLEEIRDLLKEKNK